MSESPLRPGALVLTIVLILGAGDRAHSRVKAKKAVTRTMSIAQFEDRVRGGWAGQMIGVTCSAPTEFRFRGRINEKPRNWKPEELKGALDQDDLYLGESRGFDRIPQVAADARWEGRFMGVSQVNSTVNTMSVVVVEYRSVCLRCCGGCIPFLAI